MQKIEKIKVEAQMDTHAVIGVLKTKYKLPSRTAEAIVYTVQKSQESHFRNLVTKEDLANFRTEIMNYLNKNLADLRGDMSNFKEEMNKSLSNFKVDLIKWIIGNNIVVLLLLLAIIKLM